VNEPGRCDRCQSELTRRSRPLLLFVGAALCLLPLPAIRMAWLWIPAIVMFLAGGYLIYWATAGRGLWCRQCKMIPR
jgi:hypothetical protein